MVSGGCCSSQHLKACDPRGCPPCMHRFAGRDAGLWRGQQAPPLLPRTDGVLPPRAQGSPGFGHCCSLVPSCIPSRAAGLQYARTGVSFKLLFPFSSSLWSASSWISDPSHSKSLCVNTLWDSQAAQGLALDLERSGCCSLFVRNPKLQCQMLLFPGFLVRGLLAPAVVITYCLLFWSHFFIFIAAYQSCWDYTSAGPALQLDLSQLWL